MIISPVFTHVCRTAVQWPWVFSISCKTRKSCILFFCLLNMLIWYFGSSETFIFIHIIIYHAKEYKKIFSYGLLIASYHYIISIVHSAHLDSFSALSNNFYCMYQVWFIIMSHLQNKTVELTLTTFSSVLEHFICHEKKICSLFLNETNA